MRNLLKYPITNKEAIDVLTRLGDEILSEYRIGDIRPLILIRIARMIATEEISVERNDIE